MHAGPGQVLSIIPPWPRLTDRLMDIDLTVWSICLGSNTKEKEKKIEKEQEEEKKTACGVSNRGDTISSSTWQLLR